MTVTSATSSPYSATQASAPVHQKTLGQDDFLKLLAQQFKSQDPMKPMEDTSFIAQMAQFTSLQQSRSMSQDMAEMRTQQQLVTANSYLGHTVNVTVNGETISGEVAGVEIKDGTPRLVIGESTYPVSSVVLVKPAPVGTSTATPTTNP